MDAPRAASPRYGATFDGRGIALRCPWPNERGRNTLTTDALAHVSLRRNPAAQTAQRAVPTKIQGHRAAMPLPVRKDPNQRGRNY